VPIESRNFSLVEAVDQGAEMFVPEQEQEKAWEPAWYDVAASAIRRESVAGSLWYLKDRMDFLEVNERQAGYNPLAEPMSDEDWQYADVIGNAKNPAQRARIMGSIRQERRDKELLFNSGGEGIAWMMAAGALDPAMLPLYAIPAAKGGSIAKMAASTAAVAGGTAAATEMALQAIQTDREWWESTAAIGGGVILGGLLGAAAGSLTKSAAKGIDEAAKGFDEGLAKATFDTPEPGGEFVSTVGAMAANATPLPEFKVPGSILNPQLRGLGNASPTMQRVMDNITSHNFYTARNKAGQANPVTAEALIHGIKNAEGAAVLTALSDAYKGYMGARTLPGAMIAGKVKGSALSYGEFSRRVGKALYNGDVDTAPIPIKEVNEAAKAYRASLNRIGQALVDTGALTADELAPFMAKSYRPRVFDYAQISRRGLEWRQFLEQEVRRNFVAEGPLTEEMEAGVKGIVEQITSNIGKKQMDSAISSKELFAGIESKFLKEKTLPISDKALSDGGWLTDNAEDIMAGYLREIAPEIGMRRIFGDDFELIKAREDIINEYTDLIDKATSNKDVKRLERLQKQTLEDLENVREAAYGRLGVPSASEASNWTKASRLARGITFTSQLGMMTVAAVPDMAKVIMEHGLRNFMKGTGVALNALVSDVGRLKVKELRRLGIGTEMLLSNRMFALGGVEGRTMEKWTAGFAKASLMNHWNASMKTITAIAAQDEIGQMLGKIAAGKGTDRMTTRLARWGIGKDMQARIWKQYQKGEKHKGVWFPDLDEWDDAPARFVFENSLRRDVETTIVTPGFADRPNSMVSNEWGKLIGQFKSFLLSSHNKSLIPLLQKMGEREARAYIALIAGMTLGTGVEAVRMTMAGRQDDMADYNARDWIRAAVDRSGLATVPMEIFNMSDRLSTGSISAQLGMKQGSRYFYRNWMGSLMGPTFGYVDDFANLVQNAADGNLSESDARRIRKLLPYQNMFYLRNAVFDPIQEAMGESFE
jgi:hypothetical protein